MDKQEFANNYPEALKNDIHGGYGWCMENGDKPPMRGIDRMYIGPFTEDTCLTCQIQNEFSYYDQLTIVHRSGHVAFLDGELDGRWSGLRVFIQQLKLYNETHDEQINWKKLIELYREMLTYDEEGEFFEKYITEEDDENEDDDWVSMYTLMFELEILLYAMKTAITRDFSIDEIINLRQHLEDEYNMDLSGNNDAILYVAMAVEALRVYEEADLPDFFESWDDFAEYCEVYDEV